MERKTVSGKNKWHRSRQFTVFISQSEQTRRYTGKWWEPVQAQGRYHWLCSPTVDALGHKEQVISRGLRAPGLKAGLPSPWQEVDTESHWVKLGCRREDPQSKGSPHVLLSTPPPPHTHTPVSKRWREYLCANLFSGLP